MNGKVRLPLTISLFAHDDQGRPVDPLAVLEPAFERLRRLGLIPRDAEFTFDAPPRSPTSARATIRTTILVEGAAADFATDVDRAVLAVQLLGILCRKEVL